MSATARRKIFAIMACVMSALAPVSTAKEWISIFDGKSLKGWLPKIRGFPLGEDPDGVFSVKDGAIVVSYSGKGWDNSFGHLFFRTGLSDYRIRLEYRFVGSQVSGGPDWARENSGLMLLCQPPETMSRDQDFPVSVEFQFLGAGNPVGTTGGICTPGMIVRSHGETVREHCSPSDHPARPSGEWVRAEAEVRGQKLVKVSIDGHETLACEDVALDLDDVDARMLLGSPDADAVFTEGWISLQSESHPCEFRRIEIQAIE